MHRREALTWIGLSVATSIGGCLQTAETDDGLPEAFTQPEYASGFAREAPWPIARYDSQRTAHNADTSMPDGDVGAAWLRWFDTTTTRPVTDERSLYVGNRDAEQAVITALDAERGERDWSKAIEPIDGSGAGMDESGAGVTGIAHLDDRLYATVYYRHEGGEEWQLAAVTTDGEIRWQQPLPGGTRGVLSAGNRLVVPFFASDSSADGVVAYDRDGTEEWRYTLAERDEYVSDVSCIVANTVYLPTNHGRVLAIGIDDGSTRWTNQIVQDDPKGTGIRIQSALAADANHVYVPGVDDVLYAVSTTGGAIEWTRPETDMAVELCVTDDRIYLQELNGGITAVGAFDGEDRWESDQEVHHSLVATDRGIIGTRSTRTVALDRSGDLQWEFEIQKGEAPDAAAYPMNPWPLLAHNMVYVRLADGRLYAIGEAA